MASLAVTFLLPEFAFFELTVGVLLLAAVGMLQAREAPMRPASTPASASNAKLVLAILLGAVYVATFSAEVILLSLPSTVAALDALFWAVLGAVLLTNRPIRGWLLRLP